MILNKLKVITDLPIVENSRVLVRADLDGDARLETLIPTLKYLADKKARIVIIGHKDRPGGKVVESMSLEPIAQKLRQLIPEIKFEMPPNLRFNPGEESNSPEFAQKLATNQDFYVNEAFASSHRSHASIVGVPKLLPHAAGFRFIEEVENLGNLKLGEKPILAIISGAKKDKLNYLEDFKKFCDKILVGGRLPEYLGEDFQDAQVLVARLLPDKEDITLNSIDLFKTEILKAKTIILAGPLGKYEDSGHAQGTKEIFSAVAKAEAYKVVGGGDSLAAIKLFNLADKFDWLSVGGGAMLDFLAKGTLSGIEALQEGG